MHSMGLHSALAIKRQRKRREEQKRARDRRFSSQSTESGLGESRSSCASPRNSIGSLDHRSLKSARRAKRRPHQHVVPQDKVVSSIAGELDMIGAMPAVAVRHERRRQEKRTKRPSLLYLQSPPSRSPTPSPLQSPPSATCSQPPPEVYVCGKVSVLHIVVVSLLLGAVLLIVGLVQLNPKADATQHRFLLLGSGAFLTLFGIILGMVRCCVLPWAVRKRHHRHHKDDLENGKPRNSLDVVALNQQQLDFHNKSATTVSSAGGTAKSSTTPRSSLTSSLQPRPSNATVLSPTEHEALINNANNIDTNAIET